MTSPTGCRQCGFADELDWPALPREDRCFVEGNKVVRNISENIVLYQQGDRCKGFFSLMSGIVALSTVDRHGSGLILRLVTPGEPFGYRSLLADEPHSTTATSLTPALVCRVPEASARRLIDRHGKVRRKFERRIARDLRQVREDLLRVQSLIVVDRLLHFVTYVLLPHFGRLDSKGGAIVNLPLKRRELGLCLGVAPECVSRAIRDLRRMGLADFDTSSATIGSLHRVEQRLEEKIPIRGLPVAG